MTITLAIATQKGGSGKTTTAVNLAAALAASGQRVLLIDLDGQASASAWLGASAQDGGTFDVLTGDAELGAVLTTPLPLLDVCAADARLFRLDRALCGERGGRREVCRSGWGSWGSLSARSMAGAACLWRYNADVSRYH